MSAVRNYSESAITPAIAPVIAFPSPASAAPPRKSNEDYLADLQRKVVPIQAIRRGWDLVAQFAADTTLDRCTLEKKSHAGFRRALAVTMLMYVCPLRATAFGQLRWSDVVPGERIVRVSKIDKGRKTTLLEIDYVLWERLLPLLQSLRISDDADAWLLGEELTRFDVRRCVLRVTAALAGVQYSAHWLRHTFAVHVITLMEQGCSFGLAEAISKQLGHTHRDGTVNVSTTLRYYRPTAEVTNVTAGLVA